MTHNLRLSVNVEIAAYRAEDEALARRGEATPLWVQRGHNLCVLGGRNLLRDFLRNEAPVGITHFGIGTDATAAADGDVALGNEVLREALTQYVSSPSALTIKYFLSSTRLNGQTLREAGLFNAETGPTLFARYVLSPEIEKDNSLVFTFGWVITFSAV